MTGKGLARRIGLILALTAGFFIFLTIEANATPIRPDLEKLLAEPQPATAQFTPARAGWHGPEMSVSLSPATRELLDSSVVAQEMRASLLAAAVPDWRVLLFLAFVILVLRRLLRPARRAARISALPAQKESPPAKAA